MGFQNIQYSFPTRQFSIFDTSPLSTTIFLSTFLATISRDNLTQIKRGCARFVERGRFFKVWKKTRIEEGGRFGQGSPRRAFGDAGASRRRRERRGREVAPKGLTRALKIENSKWPIFPADGTETKSRQPFIMTCIGVRAAVICTVSLQNSCRLIGPAWKNCVHPAKLRAHNFSPLDRGYIYPWG